MTSSAGGSPTETHRGAFEEQKEFLWTSAGTVGCLSQCAAKDFEDLVFHGVWLRSEVFRGIAALSGWMSTMRCFRRTWRIKKWQPPGCTRFLLEASVSDAEGIRSTGELQMLYGMAIVKFVNSYVDLEQKKVYAQSIATAARDIGIPSEVVDCRHRITHQDMPTLELLRHTANICFNYIASRYWHPQAAVIRRRIETMQDSKHLASGLVALVQDLDPLGPAKELAVGMEALAEELESKKASEVPVDYLWQCAASVAGLKQRDTMRCLKRLKVPEVFNEPIFVSATAWCQNLRANLPTCLNFIESIVHSCPHENVALSFLKDLILLIYEPETNPAATMAVFCMLYRASPNLTYRVVIRLIRSVLFPVSEDQHDCGQGIFSGQRKGQATVEATGASDVKCFGIAAETSEDDDRYSSSMHCFHRESFSLWLRALDVPVEEEERLVTELSNPVVYQKRLSAWLRCLLLLPSPPPCNAGSDNDKKAVTGSALVPSAVSLILHLFCDPQIDALAQQLSQMSVGASSSSTGGGCRLFSPNGPTLTLKNAFCQKLMAMMTTTQARVQSACRASLTLVARTALDSLLFKKDTMSVQPGVRLLLRIFKDAEVKTPSAGYASNRLLEWLARRLDAASPASLALKRQVIQRLVPPRSVDGNAVASGSNGRVTSVPLAEPSDGTAAAMDGIECSLFEEFYTVLHRIHLQIFDGRQAKEAVAALRQRVVATHDEEGHQRNVVRFLSASDVPWTDPGTLPLPIQRPKSGRNSGNSRMVTDAAADPALLVELLPLSGGGVSDISYPLKEILLGDVIHPRMEESGGLGTRGRGGGGMKRPCPRTVNSEDGRRRSPAALVHGGRQKKLREEVQSPPLPAALTQASVPSGGVASGCIPVALQRLEYEQAVAAQAERVVGDPGSCALSPEEYSVLRQAFYTTPCSMYD